MLGSFKCTKRLNNSKEGVTETLSSLLNDAAKITPPLQQRFYILRQKTVQVENNHLNPQILNLPKKKHQPFPIPSQHNTQLLFLIDYFHTNNRLITNFYYNNYD